MTSNLNLCSVILNFNQENYLMACLDAVVSQTVPVNTIYVIDNASSNDTLGILKERGYLANSLSEVVSHKEGYTSQRFQYHHAQIVYVQSATNTGAAGGYAMGLQIAYQAGFDWIWVSDADGRADVACLENLLTLKDKADFLSPVMYRQEDSTQLCFLLRKDMRSLWARGYADATELEAKVAGSAEKAVWHTASPWSSSLINRRFVATCGFPKEEYFLGGEDYEYVLRGLKRGMRVATVVGAKCYHPAQNKKTNRFIMYLLYRNYFDLIKQHYGLHMLFVYVCKNVLTMLLKQNTKELKLMLQAWLAALQKNWSLEPARA